MKRILLGLFLACSVVGFVTMNANTQSDCKNGCFTNLTISAFNLTLPINKWVEFCTLTPVPGLGAPCYQSTSQSGFESCIDNFCPFVRPFIEERGNFECTDCLADEVPGESRFARIFRCTSNYDGTEAEKCPLRVSQGFTVEDGDWANFRVPGPFTPQWQVSTNSGGSYLNVFGATHSTLSFRSLLSLHGNWYRALVTPGYISPVSRLSVNPSQPKLPQLFVGGGAWRGVVDQYSATNGSFTSHIASLDTPKGLVIQPTTGALLVASARTNRVVRFDGNTSEPLGTFVDGTVACGGLPLNGLAGIAHGPDGHLNVVDTNNNRVVQYDGTAGTCRGTYASGATLNRPNDLVFGGDGYLYVTNLSGTVARFEPLTGAPAGTVAVGTAPAGIAISPLDDSLYVTDRVASGQVYRIARSTFPSSTPTVFVSSASAVLGNPVGLAFGPDQHLYVASRDTRKILKFNGATGALLGTFVDNPSSSFEPEFVAFGALPTVNWSTPMSIPFGSALSSAQLNASANVPGTFVYSPPVGTVLPVGNSQLLTVQFTPSVRNYRPSTASVRINITGGGAATLISTNTLAREVGTNNVIVTMRIANTGGSTATMVLVNSARIGNTAAITALPAPVANVPAGGVSTVSLVFPAAVGVPGARVILTVAGTFTGGTFGQSARVVLP